MIKYFFYFGLIYPVLILLISYYKNSSEKIPVNLAKNLFYVFVLGSVSVFTFTFIGILIEPIKSQIFDDHYYATVVRYITDNNGEDAASFTIVQFKDKNNVTIEKELSIGGKPYLDIGQKIKIGYAEGENKVCNLSYSTQISTFVVFSLSFALFGTLTYWFTKFILKE